MERELSRIPQSIAYDYKAINNAFGDEDGPLIRDILIFLSNWRMKNLFGELQFTLDDFCLKMRYAKNHMQTKLSPDKMNDIYGQNSPILRSDTVLGDHFHKIETVFESALWRATEKKVIFIRQNGSSTIHTSMEIIKSLTINYDKTTKKATKRLYSVILGTEVTNLLLKQFTLIELNDYSALPRLDGHRTFYIYLIKMILIVKYRKQKGEDNRFIESVDRLCQIFNITIAEPRYRKKYITSLLNKFQRCTQNTKFEYKYIKNNTKYAYFVEFTLPDQTLNLFDQGKTAVFFQALHHAFEKIYFNQNYSDWSARKFAQHLEDPKIKLEYEKNFIEWLTSEEDLEVKKNFWVKIKREVFGSNVDL